MFHGCGGDAFGSTHLGYNEFAATNDMIVVYPDSKCWGYSDTLTDDKAFTKDGMMPKTIMSMVERVTSTDSEKQRLSDSIASTLASFL